VEESFLYDSYILPWRSKYIPIPIRKEEEKTDKIVHLTYLNGKVMF